MSSSISGNEERWSRVGIGLNTINRFLQKYLQEELRTLFHNLPMITDPNHPFNGCLRDNNGEPLRFVPDNHPTPPHGDGVQLCYRALPGYEAKVQQRKQTLQQAQIQQQPQHIKTLLQSKSQPVKINNEHELSHLFLQEYYKKQNGCDIFKLDASAILNILSKAHCFPSNIKNQSGKVRDQVRNKWAHGIIQDWTTYHLTEAFVQLKNLAGMLPNNAGLIKELEEDLLGSKPLEFPMKSFLLKIDKYRTSIKNGEFKAIEKTVTKLEETQYLKRYFQNSITGFTDSEIENMLLQNATTLLRAQAGSGKSTAAAQAVKLWSEGNHMKNITCCLFLSAGSEEKIPLYKIIWDEHEDICRWTEHETKEAYNHLQGLADEGKLAIIIDCFDAFDSLNSKDVENANRAAIHPSHPVNMKTACVGILTQKILPGAKVLGTGRYTEIINKEILENKANMINLVDITQDDRTELINMMESHPEERKRVQVELDKMSTDDSNYFLKTPLMARNIIQLIIERRFDTENLHISSEQYLQVLMFNLDFHSNQHSSFTEFIGHDDHEFLMRYLKLCQIHTQNSQVGHNNSTIKGILRNMKDTGQCFEVNELGETIQIPLGFIKKLGIFYFKNEEGVINLKAIHHRFLEFFCAGSLCRRGVDIQYELSMIKDTARFESVVKYLAGLLSKSTDSQNLCQKYLELLENYEPEKIAQDMYKAILAYPFTEMGSEALISVEGKDIKMRLENENFMLLNKAGKVSKHDINFQFNNLKLPEDKKWSDYENLLKLIEFQDDISCLKTVLSTCETEIDNGQNKAKNDQSTNKYNEDTMNFIENYEKDILSNYIPQVSIPSLKFKPSSTDKKEQEIIFVPRKFARAKDFKQIDEKELQNLENIDTFDNIEDTFEPDRPCLLQGDAGIGKSYYTSYLMSQWASKKALTKCKLCILLPCRNLDKKARLSKAEMVFQFSSLKGSTGTWKLTFDELEHLAQNEDLGILVDGLDELENITLSEIGDIMTKVYEANKDPAVALTAVELIIGILRKQIFKNCTIVGTGRPNAVNAVSSNLLDDCATVVNLLEFTEKNVTDIVHKIGCYDDKECIKDPLPLCQGILKCFAENNQVTTMARNPALCTSLIKLFMDKIENNENIEFESYTGCSLRLEILLRNILHRHSHYDQEISFTTLDSDMADALYNVAMLCCKSLVKGNLIIKGMKKKIGREEHFVSKVTRTPITLENIQQMDIFRMTQSGYGRMDIETVHLSIQEILTAGFLCSQNIDEVLESLAKLNRERLDAIITYMCGMLNENHLIDENFLEFLREKSQVFYDSEDLIQKLYSFVLNFPDDSNPDVEESFKMTGFSCYCNNKRLNDYQLHLIAKMVAISEVPCPGIIITGCDKEKQVQNQPRKLIFKELRTSISLAKDILKFLDIHNSPPKQIKVDGDFRKGMCSIMKQFLETHENVTFTLIGVLPDVELFTQNDVLSYIWLTEKGYINPQKLWRLTCSVKIDNSIISKLLPAILDVENISITCDQTNTFWESMKQIKKKWMVKLLSLDGIVLNDKIIDCAVNFNGLFLNNMKLNVAACNSLVEGFIKGLCKIEEIYLSGIKFEDGAAESFGKCCKYFKKITLSDMEINKAFAVRLSREGSKMEDIRLYDATFEDGAAESFGKCLKNVKKINLKNMEITAAFVVGLNQEANKTEQLDLDQVTFDKGTATSFGKCFKNVKKVRLVNMEITAAIAGALIQFGSKVIEIDLNEVIFKDGTAESFGKLFKNVKRITLSNMEITAAFTAGLNSEYSQPESIEFTKVTFEDGADVSFRKCFKNVRSISMQNMEITTAFAEDLSLENNKAESIDLNDITFEDGAVESFVKCFGNVKEITLGNMEITAAFAIGLNQECSKTESIHMSEIKFEDGAVELFVKYFTKIKNIILANMEINVAFAVGLCSNVSKLESIFLSTIRFENEAAGSLVKCFKKSKQVILMDMEITSACTVGLSVAGSQTELIHLDDIAFEGGDAESFVKCFGDVKIIMLTNMKITEAFAVGLSQKHNKTEWIQLNKIKFEDGATEPFVECFKRFKKIELELMEIPSAFLVRQSWEGSKIESISLDKVTFEGDSDESFVKCIKNFKQITLRNMEITAASVVGLSFKDNKAESLDMSGVTFEDGAAESFGKYFGNAKTIALRNMEISTAFATGLISECSKTEAINLFEVKFDHGAVDTFGKCFENVKRITLGNMEITETFSIYLRSEATKIESIYLDKVIFEGRSVESFVKCFKNVKQITLRNMEITAAFAVGLSLEGNKAEAIDMYEVTFANAAAESFGKCFENAKTIDLRNMEISGAFAIGLSSGYSKTEAIVLSEVKFEHGAVESFGKCFENVKSITLRNMEITAAFAVGLSSEGSKIESIELESIKFVNGVAESFDKCLKKLKQITLISMEITTAFGNGLNGDGSKIESIELESIIFEDGVVESFCKYFKTVKKITLKDMVITADFAFGLSFEGSKPEEIDLYEVSFEDGVAESFRNYFKNVTAITLSHMEITFAFVAVLSLQGSKLESIELHKVIFEERVAEPFIKYFRNVKTITMRDMKITRSFAVEFSKNENKLESVNLDRITYQDGTVEPFFKCLKNTKKKIWLEDRDLDRTTCDDLEIAFNGKLEEVSLRNIKFADGAAELFSKYMRNFGSICLWDMDINEAFTAELRGVEKIVLKDMELTCAIYESMATAFTQTDSKTEKIELWRIKFNNGAAKAFSKCFGSIRTIEMTNMDVPVDVTDNLYKVENIILAFRELDINTCENLAAALSREDSNTKALELYGIKFADGAAKSIRKCFENIKTFGFGGMDISLDIAEELYRVEKLILSSMELDLITLENLVVSLTRDDCQTETIELKRITFSEGAVKVFKKILKKIKVIFLEDMPLTAALATELSQEDKGLLKFTKIKVEDTNEATEYFINCVLNTKEVEIVEMNLKETQWDAVAKALNDSQDKKIQKITVNSSFASRINENTGICVVAAEK